MTFLACILPKTSLQKQFDKDPATFFRIYGMPLLPKEATLELYKGDLEIKVELTDSA